jgi:formate hydrogenlyase transcriptional activator
MGISAAENALATIPLGEGLVSRYEALIRLAEAIRSHPDEKDLFQTCANELHQVIPFHGLSQVDPAANWVQWAF